MDGVSFFVRVFTFHSAARQGAPAIGLVGTSQANKLVTAMEDKGGIHVLYLTQDCTRENL